MVLVWNGFKNSHEKGVSVLTWPIVIFCFVGILLLGKDIGNNYIKELPEPHIYYIGIG